MSADNAGPLNESALVFPIVDDDALLGVIELLDDARHDELEAEAEVVVTLARPIGAALRQIASEKHQLHLMERLSAAEQRQRFLADVGSVLAGAGGVAAMMRDLAEKSVPAIADACQIHMLEEDGSLVRVAATPTELPDLLIGRVGRDRDGAAGQVVATGLPLLYPHMSDSLLRALSADSSQLESLRRLGLVSGLVVPIPGPLGALGSLTLVTTRSGRVLGTEDMSLAEDVARRAGLATAHVRMYERERSIAHTLQQSLLPPVLPEIPGVELSGRFRPGGESLSVGGDFYDAFAIADDTWVLGIGDVCGHGAAAAGLSSQLRHSARAAALSCAGPAELLETINRLMTGEGRDNVFCTAVYVWLERLPTGLRATMARAGHEYPLIIRAGGTVEEVRAPGTVLGVFDRLDVTEKTLDLDGGDVLFLYTDGVTESRRGSELFGRERLTEVLVSMDGSPAAAVAEAVEESVLQFCGHRTRDDIALLVLRAGHS
ncbi:MAG TPA: GAF domain-containing SpoIIE family protein phosphatase [Acidimicrobiia bacterium]|nr:GAF domain-containing SpoIIE family protein phosphatase [Acidimicrobiia bacterium]